MKKRNLYPPPDKEQIVCYDCGKTIGGLVKASEIGKGLQKPCPSCKSIRIGFVSIVERHYGESWRDQVVPYKRYG
jgi:hypothetical protein